MENLETQEKVINLGKKLVSNFKQNDPDEITSWIINYLAEQIELAENTSCEQTKRNCFKTILQLWESHSTFPNGTRPFENFETIFKALDSLSPESSIPRYFINQNNEKPHTELDASATWVEAATKLDTMARVLISFMFKQAIENAITAETKNWLKTLYGTVDANEVNFIIRHNNENHPNKAQQRIDELANRIDQLETFENLSQDIRSELKKELTSVESLNVEKAE